jgi:hypothetical protein
LVQRKPLKDLQGERRGRLTAETYLGKGKHGKHYWLCRCDCGKVKTLTTSTFNNGYTLSCGCLRVEALRVNRRDPTRQGLSISQKKLYAIYHSMKDRCYNERNCRYKYYGGRGVTVCEDWLSGVVAFVNWALTNGYEEGLSIDRLDSSQGYHPNNCEWVSVAENSRRMNESRANEKSLRGKTS